MWNKFKKWFKKNDTCIYVVAGLIYAAIPVIALFVLLVYFIGRIV